MPMDGMSGMYSGLSTAIGGRLTADRQAGTERGRRAGNAYIDDTGLMAPGQAAVRAHNGNEAHRQFVQSIGGHYAEDPYERAQQTRNFHQTEGFKKYYDQLDPSRQLQDKLGSSAYDFRKSLAETQTNNADDIRRQSGSTLDRGLKDVRSGANNRGLLYSGLRQGAEQDYRGQVASTMAKQIAQSNSDLSKKADSMDEIAANSKLQGMQASMQAQSQVDKMNQENAVMRAQQMQQLTGMVGYGFGRWAGGRAEPARGEHISSAE